MSTESISKDYLNNQTDITRDRTSNLQWIAIMFMLMDHIGFFLLPSDTFLHNLARGIGRLSFPIFVFLLAYGTIKTKSLYRYHVRIVLATLLTYAVLIIFGGDQFLDFNVLGAFSIYLIYGRFRLQFPIIENWVIGFCLCSPLFTVFPAFHVFHSIESTISYGFGGLLLYAVYIKWIMSADNLSPLWLDTPSLPYVMCPHIIISIFYLWPTQLLSIFSWFIIQYGVGTKPEGFYKYLPRLGRLAYFVYPLHFIPLLIARHF